MKARKNEISNKKERNFKIEKSKKVYLIDIEKSKKVYLLF
jgi:hypothetical protein